MGVYISYDIDIFIPAEAVPDAIQDLHAQNFDGSLEDILADEGFHPTFDALRNIDGLLFEGEKWHEPQDLLLLALLKHARVGSYATWEAEGEHGRFLVEKEGIVSEQVGYIEFIHKKYHA